jgi:hypothetical protein
MKSQGDRGNATELEAKEHQARSLSKKKPGTKQAGGVKRTK